MRYRLRTLLLAMGVLPSAIAFVVLKPDPAKAVFMFALIGMAWVALFLMFASSLKDRQRPKAKD